MTRIMICEDEPVIQKLIRVTLAPMTYELTVARDGLEGLELVEQLRPDLIISDVYMPRLDGFGMVDAIRRLPGLETIPVLFLTAGVQREELERAELVSGGTCLSKPFRPPELRARVNQLLNTQVRPGVTQLSSGQQP